MTDKETAQALAAGLNPDLRRLKRVDQFTFEVQGWAMPRIQLHHILAGIGMVMFKVPGYHYWCGRGMPQSYAGTEIWVCLFDGDELCAIGETMKVWRLAEVPIKPSEYIQKA